MTYDLIALIAAAGALCALVAYMDWREHKAAIAERDKAAYEALQRHGLRTLPYPTPTSAKRRHGRYTPQSGAVFMRDFSKRLQKGK